MSLFETVVLVIAIVAVARMMHLRRRDRDAGRGPAADVTRAELATLRERVAVLERIVTDRGTTLEREIEALRER